MRFALLVCILGSSASAGAEEVMWRKDYRTARKDASASQKLILLDFTTSNCYWCKRLDLTTYRSGPVASLINTHFIALKVNAEQNQALARALQIDSFPTIVLATSDGVILHRHAGYQDATAFQTMLRRALTAARARTETTSEIRRVGYETPARP